MKYVQRDAGHDHRRRVGGFVDALWYDSATPVDASIQKAVSGWFDAFERAGRDALANWAGQLAGVGRQMEAPPATMDVDDIPFDLGRFHRLSA